MSSKKKSSKNGTSVIGQSSTQEFAVDRPLQTVIIAVSPLVFRCVFSPETSLLDLLVNLAPSVAGTVVVTTRQWVGSVKRCKVFEISDPELSEASILRELWGTGLGCPINGDFVVLHSEKIYANFLKEISELSKNAERVMTRIFQAVSRDTEGSKEVRVVQGSREIVKIDGLSGKIEESEILFVDNLHADIFSFEVFKILADQLDWEISDLPGNLLYSKFHDMISGEFASGLCVDRRMIGNILTSPVSELVTMVLNNIPDFFPVLPSRKIGNCSRISTTVKFDEKNSTMKNCVVTGEVELIGNFSNCLISGRAKLVGDFTDCIISGELICLRGSFINCLIIDDCVELDQQEIVNLRRVKWHLTSEHCCDLQSHPQPPMVDEGASGVVDFFNEVSEFINETSEKDMDSLENSAKQLRIFRTTQTESVEKMVQAVALAVSRKSLAQFENRSNKKTSEIQKEMLDIFEPWSDTLPEMYLDQEYLDNVGLDLLANEFGDKFWLVLWAMYQSDFFVDRKLILEWPVLPVVANSQGLCQFLAFLEEAEDSE